MIFDDNWAERWKSNLFSKFLSEQNIPYDTVPYIIHVAIILRVQEGLSHNVRFKLKNYIVDTSFNNYIFCYILFVYMYFIFFFVFYIFFFSSFFFWSTSDSYEKAIKSPGDNNINSRRVLAQLVVSFQLKEFTPNHVEGVQGILWWLASTSWEPLTLVMWLKL